MKKAEAYYSGFSYSYTINPSPRTPNEPSMEELRDAQPRVNNMPTKLSCGVYRYFKAKNKLYR